MLTWFGAASFGLAAVAYAVTTAILIASHPGGTRARWLNLAMVMSMLWALGTLILLLAQWAVLPALVGLDALHMLAWTACTVSWLASGSPPATSATGGAMPRRPPRPRVAKWLLGVAALLGSWAILGSTLAATRGVVTGVFPTLLCMALVGLLAVEQVFRNARDEQRWALWPLCVAVGGVFVIHLFTYSQAMLLNGFVPVLWESRGIANAALVPLLLVAAKRQSEWKSELFVSRQVAFYTATLLGAGAYLIAMAVVAYLIRALGGQWSLLFAIVFLVAAAGLLVSVMRSGGLQTRLRVFLVKHFYRNKYDYREEWLRLTEGLSGMGGPLALARSALAGLARIIGAGEGELWLMRDGHRYEWMASLDPEAVPKRAYEKDDRLVSFLASKRWVIDTEEYATEPDRYGTAFEHPDKGVLPRRAIVVPLDNRGSLLGFAVLSRPPELGKLNFEDHDIFKTAGKQAAAILAQALAQEQLAETRQFEAMNKLATFLMHDLKNVIAQQQLLVANAQRFRGRPEFIDDAVITIRSGLERMRRIVDQLQGTAPREASDHPTDVSKLLLEVAKQCADREPAPQIELADSLVWVSIQREKLANVMTHLLRNAQDATPAGGEVKVALGLNDGRVLITIADNGCGMDPTFLRERLFRPFDSTKGAKGMGIGAYQARETVRAVGGDLQVSSEVGVGTTFKVVLPLISSSTEQPVDLPAA